MPVKIAKGVKASYPMQFCPVIEELDLIKKKWMLPLLLELFSSKGKIHFAPLQRALNPITPKLLTQRLLQLEKKGFLVKEKSGAKGYYLLTAESDRLKALVSLLKKNCLIHS